MLHTPLDDVLVASTIIVEDTQQYRTTMVEPFWAPLGVSTA